MNPDAGFWAAYTAPTMGAKNSSVRAKSESAIAPVLPQPKRLKRGTGGFPLSAETPLLLPSTTQPLDRRLLLAAEAACREIHDRTGKPLSIARPRTANFDGPSIVCRIDPDAALEPEIETARDAYCLRVNATGVDLAAPSSDGIRYGLQTLCQLVPPSGRIPSVEIRDQPDFRDRGIMLDVSRGKVPTEETLEALVDLCSRLRLNVLMLYVEHTFDFKRHPEIGMDSSPLTAETILSLDRYAADRGVELVPCLQSLGHMEELLSIDRYAHLAESDRRWSVAPDHPDTRKLLKDLYDEFLPLFSSTRFNANCDEPFDLGKRRSGGRRANTTPGKLFTDHIGRLEGLAAQHEKRLMIWADFALRHPEQLSCLGQDVVLLDWWYEARFDANRIRALREKGFEVWACPGTSSWNCLFPRTQNSEDNIDRWADAGRRHGATGLLNTDWGDFGHYNALGVSLQSFAWGAQQAWSGAIDPKRFDRAFGQRVFGEDRSRVPGLYRKLGAIHDAGFAAVNGSALQYLYFDSLGRSFFLQHAKRAALERSAKKLAPILREIDQLRLAEADDDFAGLARQEIAWAAEATGLSIKKGLAAIEYNAWRGCPSDLKSPGRRKLARRFSALADQQMSQMQQLEVLWLARSEISDWSKVRKRIRRSITSLRDASKRLAENRPTRPAKATEISLLAVYNEVRRETGLPPR